MPVTGSSHPAWAATSQNWWRPEPEALSNRAASALGTAGSLKSSHAFGDGAGQPGHERGDHGDRGDAAAARRVSRRGNRDLRGDAVAVGESPRRRQEAHAGADNQGHRQHLVALGWRLWPW